MIRGAIMSVTEDIANTLRAQDHGHPPCVLCIEPRSPDGVPRIYADEIVPTLNTAQGGAKATMCAGEKIMKTYSPIRYGLYADCGESETLRASGGDVGGGSEVLIVEYCISDDVTPKINGGAFVTRSRKPYIHR